MQQNLDFQKFEEETRGDSIQNEPQLPIAPKITKPNLSQSLLKAYVDYYDDNTRECGLKIWKQYFLKLPTQPSEAARLGIFFEYKATEYVREGDPIPKPKMVYAGTAKEKMALDYERAADSAELFKRMAKDLGIEILAKGEYMKHDDCSGISDIRAMWKGEECIIDLKYSGLFDDKWNEYGWHTESLVYKPKQLQQPIHYKYLAKHIFGKADMPFYYFIFSSRDAQKAKIIKVNIQEEHLNIHEEITIPKMKKYVEYHFNNPEKLEARPQYLRCLECPFFDNCDKKTNVPLIEQIHY